MNTPATMLARATPAAVSMVEAAPVDGSVAADSSSPLMVQFFLQYERDTDVRLLGVPKHSPKHSALAAVASMEWASSMASERSGERGE